MIETKFLAQDFMRALSIVSAIVPKRSVHPALCNIHVQVLGASEGLRISATDTNVYVSVSMNTVNADIVQFLLSKPLDVLKYLKASKADQLVITHDKGGATKINSLDLTPDATIEDFPAVSVGTPVAQIILDSAKLLSATQMVSDICKKTISTEFKNYAILRDGKLWFCNEYVACAHDIAENMNEASLHSIVPVDLLYAFAKMRIQPASCEFILHTESVGLQCFINSTIINIRCRKPCITLWDMQANVKFISDSDAVRITADHAAVMAVVKAVYLIFKNGIAYLADEYLNSILRIENLASKKDVILKIAYLLPFIKNKRGCSLKIDKGDHPVIIDGEGYRAIILPVLNGE